MNPSFGNWIAKMSCVLQESPALKGPRFPQNFCSPYITSIQSLSHLQTSQPLTDGWISIAHRIPVQRFGSISQN